MYYTQLALLSVVKSSRPSQLADDSNLSHLRITFIQIVGPRAKPRYDGSREPRSYRSREIATV
jgi:hypothetical protein